jgi:hypothetical protein
MRWNSLGRDLERGRSVEDELREAVGELELDACSEISAVSGGLLNRDVALLRFLKGFVRLRSERDLFEGRAERLTSDWEVIEVKARTEAFLDRDGVDVPEIGVPGCERSGLAGLDGDR